MAVKFQSEEYFKELTNALQSNEAVKSAAKGQTVTVQMITTEAPGGAETKSFLKIADGVPEVGFGEASDAEATLTQTYETAVAIDKGELSGINAFMQGKLKVSGNMMKVMGLQGLMQAIGPAAAGIEREY